MLDHEARQAAVCPTEFVRRDDPKQTLCIRDVGVRKCEVRERGWVNDNPALANQSREALVFEKPFRA